MALRPPPPSHQSVSNAPQTDGDLRRWQNRSLILRHIRQQGQVSRRGLHEATGIRPNTVGEIVTDLLGEGLVEEIGEVVGRRGRRRRLLSLSSKSTVLGVELFEGAIRVGSFGLRGDLRHFSESPLKTDRRSAVVTALQQSLRPLTESGGVHGIGVAVAGVVDSAQGISQRIRGFPDWEDVPLGSLLGEAFGVPVHLGNLTDVRLVDLKHAGAIEAGMTAALVVVEPGSVGCGIVAEGHLLRGAVEASSELGQTKLWLGDDLVRLEDLTQRSLLSRRIRQRGGRPPATLSALLRSTDPIAAAVRGELAEHLGIALANLTLLIKPSKIWLTGALITESSALVKSLTRSLRANLLAEFDAALSIEVLEHGPQDGARGAAGLVLDHLFAAPRVQIF